MGIDFSSGDFSRSNLERSDGESVSGMVDDPGKLSDDIQSREYLPTAATTTVSIATATTAVSIAATAESVHTATAITISAVAASTTDAIASKAVTISTPTPEATTDFGFSLSIATRMPFNPKL